MTILLLCASVAVSTSGCSSGSTVKVTPDLHEDKLAKPATAPARKVTSRPTSRWDPVISEQLRELAFRYPEPGLSEIVAARDALSRALKEGEPHDWGNAADLIELLGDQGSSFAPLLLDLLRRPLPHQSCEKWLESLEAMDRATGNDINVVRAINAADPNAVRYWATVPEEWWSEHQRALFARYNVINALAAVARQSIEAADAIAGLAEDIDKGTRASVVLNLREMVATPKSTNALRKLAKNREQEIAPYAIEALRRRGVDTRNNSSCGKRSW